MEKKSVLIIAVVLIVVFSSVLLFRNRRLVGAFLGLQGQESLESAPVDINYGNIEYMLSRNEIVGELPKDSSVLLVFYDPDKGQREWEKSYVVTRGKVQEGYVEDIDVTVFLNSKYLKPLTSVNYCSVIQEADKNGDFRISSEISTFKLVWKYRSMLKYKNCLGF